MPADGGIILGAVGLAALVSTCLDCFELVQTSRHMGEDYVLLETRFSNQTFRFTTWAEACGLFRREGYNPGLDAPALRPRIEETLLCIKLLLGNGDKLKTKYGLRPAPAARNGATVQRWDPFEAFKTRIRRTQSANILSRPRWVINDKKKFEELIERYHGFIEDLESFTKHLDTSEVQNRTVQDEVNRILDIETLETIEAAHLGSSDSISDAASVRLAILRAPSTSEENPGASSSRSILSAGDTFYTAPSVSNGPECGRSGEEINHTRYPSIDEDSNEFPAIVPPASEESHGIAESVDRNDWGIISPIDLTIVGKQIARVRPIAKAWAESIITPSTVSRRSGNSLRRLSREIMMFSRDYQDYSFIHMEILGSDPFFLWGVIEGPPSTPYEGGIFHLSIEIPSDCPFSPPYCRFLTKIYHPNIDPQGLICCDILTDGYNPTVSLLTILISLYSLFDDPGVDDPYVPAIAEEYIKNRAQYDANARTYTAKYAQELLPSKEFVWEHIFELSSEEYRQRRKRFS